MMMASRVLVPLGTPPRRLCRVTRLWRRQKVSSEASFSPSFTSSASFAPSQEGGLRR